MLSVGPLAGVALIACLEEFHGNPGASALLLMSKSQVAVVVSLNSSYTTQFTVQALAFMLGMSNKV
jgi:hypothetical protein